MLLLYTYKFLQDVYFGEDFHEPALIREIHEIYIP